MINTYNYSPQTFTLLRVVRGLFLVRLAGGRDRESGCMNSNYIAKYKLIPWPKIKQPGDNQRPCAWPTSIELIKWYQVMVNLSEASSIFEMWRNPVLSLGPGIGHWGRLTSLEVITVQPSGLCAPLPKTRTSASCGFPAKARNTPQKKSLPKF